jgi:hypothetical protein
LFVFCLIDLGYLLVEYVPQADPTPMASSTPLTATLYSKLNIKILC